MVNEEKRNKFVEFAGKRVNNVLHDIQILEPMARSAAYDFTRADVDAMFNAMQETLNEAREEFNKKFEEKARAEKKVFSYLLGLKPQDIFVRPMMELSLNSDWSLMVWALGRLGMGELLVKLFILEEQARLKATSMKSLDYEFCFINALKQFIQKGDVEAPISIAPPVTPIETNTDSVYQDDLPMDYPTALKKEMKVVWSLDYQSGRKYILNLNADVLKIIAVSVPVPLYDINTQWQNFIEHYRLTPYLNYTILSTAQVYVGEEYYIAIIRLYIERGRRLLFAEKEELALRQKFAEASGRPFVFIEYQEPDYGFDY